MAELAGERVTALLANPPPSLRTFLVTRRDELNVRFFRLAQRYPKLHPDLALLQLAEILPLHAGDEPGAERLLSTIYDLVLLHVARDAFSRQPALATLLRATLIEPSLRRLALEAPERLPAELSNAIENLGSKALAFVAQLGTLAARAPNVEALLLAGAVLAWRLGESRLRKVALAALSSLDPALWLTALGEDRPAREAATVAAALQLEGWRTPSQPAGDVKEGYEIVARLGRFSGFGGVFDRPPELVVTDADDLGDRHHFHVQVGETIFRVEADCYGASLRPAIPGTLGAIRPALHPTKAKSKSASFTLTQAGALQRDGSETLIPELAGATSFLGRDRLVVVTLKDSHAIRVLAPRAATRA